MSSDAKSILGTIRFSWKGWERYRRDGGGGELGVRRIRSLLNGQASAHIIQNQMLFLGEVGGRGGGGGVKRGGGGRGGGRGCQHSSFQHKNKTERFCRYVLSGGKKRSQQTEG